MLRYAQVDGEKRLPFPKGRGLCPRCGGLLVAKCGTIVTHHWAHDTKDDCDSWSEPIGPWHLWWQNLVRADSVEVARGQHRADIVGNGGVVVELQHSSISAEDIAAREAYYGNMVWLFDATMRFASVDLHDRSFFSIGRTKHLELCKKPVFFDFGFNVVEVTEFTDAITMVSGYGIPRSRGWFVDNFLSDVRETGSVSDDLFVPDGGGSDPWSVKSPVWKMKHQTKWIDPISGKIVTYPKWTEYIKLNYCRWNRGDKQNRWYDYDLVIDQHPEIANGWTKNDLREIKDFLRGTAIILGGLLRVLPAPASSICVARSVSSTRDILVRAEGHIREGRVPVLKETTKSELVTKAEQYEVQQYGRLLQPDRSQDEGPSLFQ